jgi:hypothetical protein
MRQNQTTYYNATPELLKNKQQIRDRLLDAYQKVAQECFDLRMVLGLDNPESLTYTAEANTLFFELCEQDAGFASRYAANPVEGEKELAIAMARFESEAE